MDKSNIVLIGMPGAGKSTIGVLLAKAMGLSFIDTDLLIQQKEKRLLQDIINNDGIIRFLDVEEEVILGLDAKNSLIATGGSVIYREASIKHLKRDGILVYLELAYDEIESRISNISSRGVAMSKGQSLLGLYNERIPLYEKYADITVNCSQKHIEKTVSEIMERLYGKKVY